MDNNARVKKIIKILHKEYPNSKCGLIFHNPFDLLVGTVLSAQTTDNQVNNVLPKLFNAFPDPVSMSQADPEDIKILIKSLGLYNNNAKSLSQMSKKIVDDFGGKVPPSMEKLLLLPGVGRKTANVVLGNALGVVDSGITVDTHVIRLSQRLNLTLNKTANKIEKDLMKIVLIGEWVDITHLFIDHGRKICGRKPHCDNCVISECCPSKFNFPHFSKV